MVSFKESARTVPIRCFVWKSMVGLDNETEWRIGCGLTKQVREFLLEPLGTPKGGIDVCTRSTEGPQT